MDFVRCWSEKTEINVGQFPPWLGIGASKFYDWRQRYGRGNEHNGWIREAAIDYLPNLSENSPSLLMIELRG